MVFLGLDIGTSAVKAVLVDEAETVVATAAVTLATHHPQPGWSEQDPDDWWRAAEAAIAELGATAPHGLREVTAIGLSGQMHAAVLLDGAGHPVRPAILWNDGRAVAECDALAEAVPDIGRLAGVLPMPGFTAPKLLWLRRHEPVAFGRMRRLVLPKDYVRLKLSGDIATDMVDAAGTLLLDEAKRDWSEPLLAAAGVGREVMPQLLESVAVSGRVRPDVASRLGLPASVLVAAGAGDAAAGAIGLGAIADGDRFISLGTSAQVFVTRDRYQPKPETLVHAFAHALPGRWFEMAALLNGANCLDWVARLLGAFDIGALLDAVEAGYDGPSPVLFLPYLSGERTPINDPAARGAFAGLDLATGGNDLVQAVLEGVAFALLDGRLALGSAWTDGPVPIVGGGARSRLWLRIIANVLGQPIQRIAGAERGAAFGAARLARLAATGEEPGMVCTKPAVLETIEPDRALHGRYAERFAAFRGLHRALRDSR